jgi:hypothetical protein
MALKVLVIQVQLVERGEPQAEAKNDKENVEDVDYEVVDDEK